MGATQQYAIIDPQTGKMDRRIFIDQAIYDEEMEKIFGRAWLMIGHESLVPQANDFFHTYMGEDPVILTRDSQGQLHALLNMCRHRGNRVVRCDDGNAQRFMCTYHGWTYDLAGNLRGTPEFDGVRGFAKEDNGLVAVAVAEWGPFVWVHLEKPGEPLEPFLGPLPAWAGLRKALDGLTWYARKTYNLACNWKVYVDNYLDGGYHVNTVHPALAGVLDYREYKTVPDGNTVLQSSPITPGEGEAGRTRTGDIAAYWWVWPNFMMNVYEGVMDSNLVLPLGVDRCRVIFDFYFSATVGDDFKAESVRVAEQVQDEDIGVCEEVQRNLNSRSYTTGRYSVKRENGGHYFHQMLGRALQGTGDPRP
jgi:choline monooxygenase